MAGGPCLVKMNCRAQGGHRNWWPLLCAINGGYSQVEATIDVYLDKKAFWNVPSILGPAKAFGQEVILVSYAEGDIVETLGYNRIKELESFVYLETGLVVRSKVEHTGQLADKCRQRHCDEL